MSSAADDEHKREEEEIDLDDLLDGASFTRLLAAWL